MAIQNAMVLFFTRRMGMKEKEIKFCQMLLEKFGTIGAQINGGFTRLAYTETEDAMHEMLESIGRELGFEILHDTVGNTFVANSLEENYYLIGSHLDSVVDGGQYDGPAGVIAGLMVMKWVKESGLNIPIRVVGFRCEESSNFGCCTIGSGLITGELKKDQIAHMVGRNGKTVEQVFQEYGFDLEPPQIQGMKQYLEVHIEQGKVLEELETQIGIVSTIAGPIRYYFHLEGMAEHSGATPMGMRFDALCAAAEIILAIESIGKEEAINDSVTTVGVIENHPNAMNVVPGNVKIGVDIRGIDSESLQRIEKNICTSAKEICENRKITIEMEKIGEIAPVPMSTALQTSLEKAAIKCGFSVKNMMSGAGHDAMAFPHLCETGLVFIPCKQGVSHNKLEYTEIENIYNGAKVLFEHIKDDRI